MEWIYFYLIPLAAAWRKRTDNLGCAVFSLYKTMFGVFLAFWCEALVRQSILRLIPQNTSVQPWLKCISVAIIWLLIVCIIDKITEKLLSQELDNFLFPATVSKILVPITVFFNAGLICAMVFTIFAISPAAKYLPVISNSDSLCASARFRILCNTFFIDRFSWQPCSINQRRRAFDRFIPESRKKVPSSRQKTTGY